MAGRGWERRRIRRDSHHKPQNEPLASPNHVVPIPLRRGPALPRRPRDGRGRRRVHRGAATDPRRPVREERAVPSAARPAGTWLLRSAEAAEERVWFQCVPRSNGWSGGVARMATAGVYGLRGCEVLETNRGDRPKGQCCEPMTATHTTGSLDLRRSRTVQAVQ